MGWGHEAVRVVPVLVTDDACMHCTVRFTEHATPRTTSLGKGLRNCAFYIAVTMATSSSGALRVGRAEAPPPQARAASGGTTPIVIIRSNASSARRSPSNNGAKPIGRYRTKVSPSIVAALPSRQESSSSSSGIAGASRAFEIRKATPRDAHALSVLYSESYNEALPRHYSEQELAEAMPTLTTPSPRMLASCSYYVAFQRSHDDGNRAHHEELLLGAGAWEPDDMNYASQAGRDAVNPELAHIRHFATKP